MNIIVNLLLLLYCFCKRYCKRFVTNAFVFISFD